MRKWPGAVEGLGKQPCLCSRRSRQLMVFTSSCQPTTTARAPQVSLPSAITGAPDSSLAATDPRVKALHGELETLNRRLQVRPRKEGTQGNGLTLCMRLRKRTYLVDGRQVGVVSSKPNIAEQRVLPNQKTCR